MLAVAVSGQKRGVDEVRAAPQSISGRGDHAFVRGVAVVKDLTAWAAALNQGSADRMKEPLRICELSVRGLGVSGCGISMVTRTGNRAVVCATDDVSAHLEDLQFTLGEGPGFEANDTGVPVLIDDVNEAGDRPSARWPAFTQAAASAGAGAVFAFPLRVGPLRLGALNLYRVEPGSLSSEEVSGALLAAQAAAVSLLHLDATAEDAFDDDRTARASYQMQVHQAAGMVKVQAGGSVQDALAMLRAHAFGAEVSLAQVARDVVERRLRFTSENI
jgi:hypothetical protein